MARRKIYWDDSLHKRVIRRDRETIHLAEYSNNNIISGAYLKMSNVRNSDNRWYQFQYVENNQPFGPFLNVSKSKLEYSFIYNNPISFKFSIDTSNRKETYYIGAYDHNGKYLGKGIIVSNDGTVSFVKSKAFREVTDSKVAIKNRYYLKNVKPYVLAYPSCWDIDEKSYKQPIVYYYEGEALVIDAKGVMFGPQFRKKLDYVESYEDLNYRFGCGYGLYEYNQDNFFLGYVTRGEGGSEDYKNGWATGANVLGFNGPCIRKNGPGKYAVGNRKFDKREGFTLDFNLNDLTASIGFYEQGVANGISFTFTSTHFYIDLYNIFGYN